MVSSFALWPCIAGPAFLILGLISAKKDVASAPGNFLDRFIVLGPTFVAASFAVFAAEHLAGGSSLLPIVPAWMPARLFWVYFVGVCLLLAAISLALKKYLSCSAPLLALLILIFVATIHLPNIIASPHGRILWTVLIRDTAFAAGALALAATVRPRWRALIPVTRIYLGFTLIFFAIMHFFHPYNAPGVPLPKMTPAWVPLPVLWASLTGIVLLITGLAILVNRSARAAAAIAGLAMTVLTFLLYLPILLQAHGTGQIIEGINYVFDTLLFAGTLLLLAAAITRDKSTPSQLR